MSTDGRTSPGTAQFRATVSYDGTAFEGWQVQGERRTVQRAIEEALERALGTAVPVLAAGRTDSGVHAEGQVISFCAATTIPPGRIPAAVNRHLPEDVALLDAALAPRGFHATRDATGKVYRYAILESAVPRPLLRRTAWRVGGRLDLRRMREAARHLVGRRDFRSFRTNPGIPGDRGTTVRTLRRVEVRRRGGLLLLDFEGDGFLYNMVRAMAGTLVQVGRGAWTPERVAAAVRARDRSRAGPTAPAHGLTLLSVEYGAGRRAPGTPRLWKDCTGAEARSLGSRHGAGRGPRRRADTARATEVREMNVRLTGRHVGIPEADRSWVEEKVENLSRFHRHLQDIEVRVTRDGAEVERVELEAALGRTRIVVHSDAAGFRPAFDDAVERMKRQILRDKEKVRDRRRRTERKRAGGGRSK